MYKPIEKIREEIREIHTYTVWVRAEIIERFLDDYGIRYSKSMDYLVDGSGIVFGYKFRTKESILNEILDVFTKDYVVYRTVNGR